MEGGGLLTAPTELLESKHANSTAGREAKRKSFLPLLRFSSFAPASCCHVGVLDFFAFSASAVFAHLSCLAMSCRPQRSLDSSVLCWISSACAQRGPPLNFLGVCRALSCDGKTGWRNLNVGLICRVKTCAGPYIPIILSIARHSTHMSNYMLPFAAPKQCQPVLS